MAGTVFRKEPKLFTKACIVTPPLFLVQTFAFAGDETGWQTYKGAWFRIDYPADFNLKPSLKSSSANGFESVFFVSPDESVEFYVFSPQWNGNPSDIQLNPKTEQLVSQKTQNLPDTVPLKKERQGPEHFLFPLHYIDPSH